MHVKLLEAVQRELLQVEKRKQIETRIYESNPLYYQLNYSDLQREVDRMSKQ